MKSILLALFGTVSILGYALNPISFDRVQKQTFKSVSEHFFYEDEGVTKELTENDVWAYDLVEFKFEDKEISGFVASTYANGWVNYGADKVRHACWTTFVKKDYSWKAVSTECEAV